MDAVTSKRQKKMSKRQEDKVAADIGGRTVAGSGAGRTSGGGDVRRRSELRVECKVTEKDYYVLHLNDLEKIRKQAINGGLEQPVMQLRFQVPRAMVEEFAIEPCYLEKGRIVDVLRTDRKRVKLLLSDLQLALLRTGQIIIEFNGHGIPQHWQIRRWATFLEELEKLC